MKNCWKILLFLITILQTSWTMKQISSIFTIPSLFDKFPPAIHFPPLNRCQRASGSGYYRYNQIFSRKVKCAGINITVQYSNYSNGTDLIENGYIQGFYTKLRALPCIYLLNNKMKIRLLYQNLERRLGVQLPWLIQSYNLPIEKSHFRAAWERNQIKHWVLKTPKGTLERGIRIISHWNQVPKFQQFSVQKYIHNPFLYKGRKVELTSFFLITGVKPLKIYHLHRQDRFKQQFTNYTTDEKSFRNRCIHINGRRFPECGWSQRSEYHRPTIASIFESIENSGGNVGYIYEQLYSIVITTLLEWENKVIARHEKPKYGNYMRLSFDCFIDDGFKLWLNEPNWLPNIFPDTPNFYEDFTEMFNIIGIKFPPIPPKNTQELLQNDLLQDNNESCTINPSAFCHEPHLCNNTYPEFAKNTTSLDTLNICEIKLLALIEDELNRAKKSFARRILPSDNMSQYFTMVHPDHRHYYMVLEKWEKLYKDQRSVGRTILNDRLNNDIY